MTWNLSAVTDAVAVYVMLFVIVGIPAVATSVGLQSMIQAITPPTHLGRVFAAFETGAGALQAVGVIVAGALADRLGVLPILNVQGSIYVLCGIAALVVPAGADAVGARTRRRLKDRGGSRRSRLVAVPVKVPADRHFCHAPGSSIASAEPTTLTQPTHDPDAGAAMADWQQRYCSGQVRIGKGGLSSLSVKNS